MKVKILEQFNKIFLIERYYKKLDHVEYIVCSNYDFKSNTYSTGMKVLSLPQAYDVFNDYVNTGSLGKGEDLENGNVEESNQ